MQTFPYLSEEEALNEFEAELSRLEAEEAERQRHYDSGAWAMAACYARTA